MSVYQLLVVTEHSNNSGAMNQYQPVVLYRKQTSGVAADPEKNSAF